MLKKVYDSIAIEITLAGNLERFYLGVFENGWDISKKILGILKKIYVGNLKILGIFEKYIW